MSVKTALIVDDSRVARLALARRLGARGIDVVSVASGADALRKLQNTRPDVIFMDYMMPQMDGLEACQAIVNNPSTSAIPVIMTTSNDTPEFRKRGVASGAHGFLSKGLEDRELDNVLESVARPSPESEPTKGAAMASDRAELDSPTLAMIRDQAVNAARRASEEYFTGQLPGLEEQVIQVAESTARKVAAGAAPVQVGVDAEQLQALQKRVDNLYGDKPLRAAILKIVREEAAGSAARERQRRPREAPPRPSGGFGRFVRNLLILAVFLVVAYAVIVLMFPDTPLAVMLQDIARTVVNAVGSAVDDSSL